VFEEEQKEKDLRIILRKLKKR